MKELHVDSVMKSFGNRQVLTDVFLSCSPGEIIGLLGRNGAGKSTLMKIIFGSMQADQKFVRVEDKIIKGISDNRNLISYLPQNHFLPNHVKISIIISLFCKKTNASLLKKHDLIKPMLNKKTWELSTGEKRILEIFLIIHSEAKYVLIDEPFNGVSPIYKEVVKNLIKEHSKTKGFIITDHDYRNILNISDRIILIQDGGTKEISRKEELKFWGYIPEI